ncbi:hypothetical protein AMTR_s00125p00059710 [Amborella trichopoda]|uniref:Uncharacterized protein n=1 Tax=Amborella trichopoda TaxID=13333 RepID=W1NRW6_AMBTC|nr:hypothetical protein AMTR_s00125p00059710 [Amborella trichopoda]
MSGRAYDMQLLVVHQEGAMSRTISTIKGLGSCGGNTVSRITWFPFMGFDNCCSEGSIDVTTIWAALSISSSAACVWTSASL